MSQITQGANEALKSIQEFNVDDLSREEELGRKFSFSGAVSHVSKIKDFYGQLSHEFVDSLPDTIAGEIRGNAKTSYENLINIMEFDPVSGVGERDRLIEVVKDDYSSVFRVLYPLIAYGSSVTGNIQAQVEEFRAIIDQAQEEVKKTGSEINDKMAEADRMLENIRQVSSEHAVSQHAVHFKKESDSHLEAVLKTRTAFEKLSNQPPDASQNAPYHRYIHPICLIFYFCFRAYNNFKTASYDLSSLNG